jgi:hypothetical protein
MRGRGGASGTATTSEERLTHSPPLAEKLEHDFLELRADEREKDRGPGTFDRGMGTALIWPTLTPAA